MKVLSWMILHYGAEYLKEAIESAIPFSDKCIILYSDKPSQGHNTELRPLDTKEKLQEIALKFPKVEWIDVVAGNEGDHTGLIYKYSQGYDILHRFDSDEIFDKYDLSIALENVAKGDTRYYRVNGFLHFWKSFNYVCTDHYAPARFTRPDIQGESWADLNCRVYHFGYCQNIETIKYKLKVTGHYDEIRPEWLSMYENWTPETTSLHPVSRDIWHKAIPFDKNELPTILKNHPNYNKEVV